MNRRCRWLVHDSHNRIYGDAILQWDHLYRPAFSRLHDDHLPITAHTVRAVGYPLLQLRDHLVLMREQVTSDPTAFAVCTAQHGSERCLHVVRSDNLLDDVPIPAHVTFNSAGLTSSRIPAETYQAPPNAVCFAFPAIGRCWRGSSPSALRWEHVPGAVGRHAFLRSPHCLRAESRCSRSCSTNRCSCSRTTRRHSRSHCCSTDRPPGLWGIPPFEVQKYKIHREKT